MAVRNLALVGCALLVCVLAGGGGYPQEPTGQTPAVPNIPGVGLPTASAPSLIGVSPPTIPQAPAPKTVDQLIEDLTELRRQKAELDKQEQAVVKQLRDKLKEQKDRLSKLNIEAAPVPNVVPAVGAGLPIPGPALPDVPGVR